MTPRARTPRWHRRRLLTALTVLGVSHALLGCGDDADSSSSTTGSGSSSSGGTDLSDVIYEGGATDEALIALLARNAPFDEAQGTRFLAPAPGASLPNTPPPTFSWAVGTVAELPARGVLERFVGLLLGVSPAYAHGAPISGRGYFVVFSGEGAPALIRVFTTNLDYTPEPAVWARLQGQTGPIEVTIINAIFEENRVAQAGGPFLGTTLGFSVTP